MSKYRQKTTPAPAAGRDLAHGLPAAERKMPAVTRPEIARIVQENRPFMVFEFWFLTVNSADTAKHKMPPARHLNSSSKTHRLVWLREICRLAHARRVRRIPATAGASRRQIYREKQRENIFGIRMRWLKNNLRSRSRSTK